MFFRKLELPKPGKRFKGDEPLVLAAYSFRARYPTAIIHPNDEVMELLASHPKCPKATFLWAGEFEVESESGEYVRFWVAGDGSLYSADTQVVIMPRP